MVLATTSFYPQKNLFCKRTPILSSGNPQVIQERIKPMWIIGLTGAIGAGKSTIAQSLRLRGIPVHCADQTIHWLLKNDPEVQKKIKALWPEVGAQGNIDRFLLGNRVLSSFSALTQLEDILYPKLVKSQKRFLLKNNALRVPCVVLDVPLLMETGLDRYCHRVIVASSPFFLRKQRVLKRDRMTLEKFFTFESFQISEQERKKRADFVIPTGRGKGRSLQKMKESLISLLRHPVPLWQGRWPTHLKREIYGTRNCLRHRNNRI